MTLRQTPPCNASALYRRRTRYSGDNSGNEQEGCYHCGGSNVIRECPRIGKVSSAGNNTSANRRTNWGYFEGEFRGYPTNAGPRNGKWIKVS